MPKEEFEALLNKDCYVLDKFTFAIELGNDVNDGKNKYLFFQSYVYENEMYAFLEHCEMLVQEHGYTLAISTGQTNFGDIVTALQSKGYKKERNISHPYSGKAVVFQKQRKEVS